MKFVVYEVWTRARVIEAIDEHEAYDIGEPTPKKNMNLCNWHVVSVDSIAEEAAPTGGLNYRQVK